MKTKLFTLLLAVVVSVGTMLANQVWPIIMDETTFATCNSGSTVVASFRPNEEDRFIYIWENTYYAGPGTGLNFMGNTDGYLSFIVGPQGWAGAGFCLTNDGNSWQAAEQLRAAIVANPDNYYLHMAIKSTDNYSHCFSLFGTEATKFVLGNHSVYDGPVFSDFTRDGAWHEFYIPMSTYASALASVTCSGETNIFVMQSEGIQGAMLDLDAVYICDEEFMNPAIGNLHVQIGDLYYNLDATNQTAEVTSQSKSTSNYMGLTTAIIPASVEYNSVAYSVTSIGDGAFYNCSGLTSVVWNAKNCADFSYNNTPFYADYYDEEQHHIQFDLRPQITSFTFGNEVEHIPAYLCSGMSNLISVTIPNSVTSIGERAFYGCRGLTGELVIPNSVTSIGRSTFENCSGLISITIPNSVTNIGSYAFYDCSGLTSVTIPNSVTSIGNSALAYCDSLTSVEAPAGFFDITEVNWLHFTKILSQVTINAGELTENALLFINRSYKTLQTLDVSGVTNTEFADEAFKGYYNLQALVLPEGLQKVSYMMVAECKNLQSIDIPASVEEIEQSAFENCRSLASVEFLGDALTRIGNWAFYNCHALENIGIPAGVTEIGAGAFYGCTYLNTLSMPASVQSIGDNAFALCSKISQMDVDAVEPPAVEDKTFYEVSTEAPVYVPDESVTTYKAHPVWGRLNIIGKSASQGIEEVPSHQVQTTKILRNGQIFILRGEKAYTLQGQEVK